MHLDIRTLAVAVTLATAFCAAARVLLWRMHPGVPGLGRWTWAGVSSAVALVLYSEYGRLPDWVTLSLPQFLIAAGLTLAWDGFRRFFGRGPLPRALLIALAVAVLVPLTIAQMQSWMVLRTACNSVLMAAMSAAIARELLRPCPWAGAAARATAYVYMANCAFFVWRLGLVLWLGGEAHAPHFPAAALLWWLCTAVAVTLGMALMTGERLQSDLDRQASRDPLTGALNRRAFSAQAEREVARARRSGRPLSVLMMDLDHFKQINDQLGHAVGDDILCRFVAVAGQVLRGEDLLSRFGGEEFVALLPDTAAEQALLAGERLRAAFCQAVTCHPGHVFSVSMGVGQLRPDEELEATLRRADRALYQAKAAGRNCCVLADELGTERALQHSL